jgi:plastocyanin
MMRMFATLVVLALAGCAGGHAPLPATAASVPDSAWAQASTVEIKLDDFDFEPQTLTLEANRPYKLHFVNNGSGGHNFDAPAFFRTVQLRSGAATDTVRASGGIVELKRGESLDLFLVPSAAGTYPVECSHTLHASFGMVGSVVVR